MLDGLSTGALLALFLGAAAVIALAGVRMTGIVDRIADRTGLGEAVAGGALLGMATSLSGLVVSVSAAIDGQPSLAFSNAVGGIAVQIAFLALADLVYRRVNLEHAAADLANVFQAAMLGLMLSLPLIAYTGPEAAVLGTHPVSFALILLYAAGLRATSKVRQAPMWRPVATSQTAPDLADPAEVGAPGGAKLAAGFLMLAAVLACAGLLIAEAGARLSLALGISQTTVGALMTAVVTSLPELVTTLSAVRNGAVTLAVGGIIGGNAFDALFLTVADAGYREGSLYHAIAPQDLFWLTVGLAMNTILLIGLILRERQGPGNIGIESFSILVLYFGAVAVQATLG